MNSIFKTIAALTAAALPAAFSAESLGISLPSAFNTSHAFGAFVIALTLLTLMTDYSPRKSLVPCTASAVPANRRSSLRLAA